MDDQRYRTAHTNSLTKSANASVTQALADRLILSEAVDLVGRLTSAFPNGGGNAGDGYIGALAAVLCEYPRQVAIKCCDPSKGVAREVKFLPTVSDVVSWCERETAAMRAPADRVSRWESLKAAAQARAAADFRRDEPPKLGATYSDLCELYGIRAIPPGWDAVDVARAKSRYGDQFHAEVEKALLASVAPPSVFAGVVEKARAAMERNTTQQAAE